LMLSFRRVGSFCNAFWIWFCRVAVSFMPIPAVAVPAVPPALALTPALEPIAVPPVLDRALGAVAVAAPAIPPVVLGVLVVDCAVEVELWPAMF